MADPARSRRSGRELAGSVVSAERRRYWMKQEVTVTAWRHEADSLRMPAPPLTASAEGKALRKLVLEYTERPRRVRSRIRVREVAGSAI